MKSYKKKYQLGGEKTIGIPVSYKDIQGTILPLENNIPYTNLPEVIITEKAPYWLSNQRAYEAMHPFVKSEFGNNEFINRFSPGKKRGLLDLYGKRRDSFVGKKLLQIKPNIYGHDFESRLKWFNQFSPAEQAILSNADLPEFRPAQRAALEYQSDQAKKYTISELFSDPNKLSQSVSGTGERFRLFPNASSNIESWINPFMMVGDMATGLGNVPLNVKNKNYGYATLGVASPLLTGSLGTIGSNTTGQWIKNTFLPIAGAEIDIPTYIYNGVKNRLKESNYVKSLNPFYVKNTNKKLELLNQQHESFNKNLKTFVAGKRDNQGNLKSINHAIYVSADAMAYSDMRKRYPGYYKIMFNTT